MFGFIKTERTNGRMTIARTKRMYQTRQKSTGRNKRSNNKYLAILAGSLVVIGATGTLLYLKNKDNSLTAQPTQPVQPIQPVQHVHPTQLAAITASNRVLHIPNLSFGYCNVFLQMISHEPLVIDKITKKSKLNTIERQNLHKILNGDKDSNGDIRHTMFHDSLDHRFNNLSRSEDVFSRFATKADINTLFTFKFKDTIKNYYCSYMDTCNEAMNKNRNPSRYAVHTYDSTLSDKPNIILMKICEDKRKQYKINKKYMVPGVFITEELPDLPELLIVVNDPGNVVDDTFIMNITHADKDYNNEKTERIEYNIVSSGSQMKYPLYGDGDGNIPQTIDWTTFIGPNSEHDTLISNGVITTMDKYINDIKNKCPDLGPDLGPNFELNPRCFGLYKKGKRL